MPTFHFHISRAARSRYNVNDSLFSLRGNVVLPNFYAARLLAQQINETRGGEIGVQAGELNALGLIHEILHAVLQQYRAQRGDMMAQAVNNLYESVGQQAVDATLQRFVDEFPPLAVYRGQQTIQQYLAGSTEGISNREIALEELILVWIENQNPAASPFKELFDDTALAQTTAYPRIVQSLRDFFTAQGPIGPTGETLFDALRAPFINAPDSLGAQLDYMLYRWTFVTATLDVSRFFSRVVGGIQFIQEEQRFLWTQQAQANQSFGGGFTSTTPPVPTFTRGLQMRIDTATGQQVWYEPEPEQFSPDLDWMPNLVLLAKSTYVWLSQLTKKYGREIKRLDQIPDQELDEMRTRGITGLWFIGVWERSKASAEIKHMMGNPDAIASAYSLADYEIAAELGGKEALEQLKARAWKRGIRLASDMVPNHMGIDSRWVSEHPDWFISSKTPPYPAYHFSGPDLSSDPRITIQIEDHYFDKTDAAVVFKRTDKQTGEARYIYHGNDGTSFPWNDTAQLDYLQAQVREQVIQTILNVARQTPVIRFDAAMTLAKKHYQRLWYPAPGENDTIPSRGEYSMTKAEFDAAMPEEFWRQVVDRVATEAPDTLLLAEAFWLMEGYFVRTLGMHRVYNSAFMHMLRDEKNQEYRLVIKNTIEFDPEVLKRYVNFMNNPDERTAVDQFGKGDKYFGVAVMLATLPGLPMFGHGQIEGFSERYGMEFRAAMLDETPDPWLMERHTREVFPLLHKRYLFANVENFLLYDLYRPNRTVAENVYVYSNRVGSESALIAYNNSFVQAQGMIRLSAAFRDKTRDELVQRTLADGLALRDEPDTFLIYRDAISGNEFLRTTSDVMSKGLDIALGGYKYVVYLDFRQVADTPEKAYASLHERLHGRGVPSIEQAIRDIQLAPLHAAFRDLMNANTLREIRSGELVPSGLNDKAVAFAQVLEEYGVVEPDARGFARQVIKNVEGVRQLTGYALPGRASVELKAAVADLKQRISDETLLNGLAAYSFLQALETFATTKDRGLETAARMDEWQLGRLLGDALRAVGVEDARIWQLMSLFKIALQHPIEEQKPNGKKQKSALAKLVQDPMVAGFLGVNLFDGVEWFNREQFDTLTNWLSVVSAFTLFKNQTKAAVENTALIEQHARWTLWRDAEAKSGYQVDKLLGAAAPQRAARANSPVKAKSTTTIKSKPAPKKTAAAAKSTGKPAPKKTPVKPTTAKSKPAVEKPAAKPAASSKTTKPPKPRAPKK